MATATATLTEKPAPYNRDETQRREIFYGNCALSVGGTYATNGIPLNWQFVSAIGGAALRLSTATQPSECSFFSRLVGIYQYTFDETHNTLRITSLATGAELANGAAITADTIGFRAEFLRGY